MLLPIVTDEAANVTANEWFVADVIATYVTG